MAKKPIRSNSLRDLYNRLVRDAPEAAVGVAAVSVMIFLVTAQVQFSSYESKAVLLGVAALFGLVGVAGFILAIYRARS